MKEEINIDLGVEDRKLRLIVQSVNCNDEDRLREVIFHPKNRHKGEFIKFGGYFADQAHGWYRINEIQVVSVLEEMEKE